MLVVAGLALVSAVFQQQVPNDTSKRAPRDSAAYRLESVTIRERANRGHRYAPRSTSTATKTNTLLRDTPQSVSLITQSLIREQSMQSMSDALRYAPGVTMGQGEGHRDAPTIRGQSSTADFFVDGVRDDAQYFRDLYNVERVEVLGGSNAMIFGRGGGGGVVNRVLKKAQREPTRDLLLEGGSFAHVRGSIDVGGPLTSSISARLNGMSEHSGTFRNGVELSRDGVNPNMAFVFGDRTLARAGGEYFEDRRVVDRGLPSFRGVPSPAPLATFFGNRDSSRAALRLRGLNGSLERQVGDATSWRTQARVTRYDKFYQNVFPGAVDSAGARVNLSAYNNAHDRTNWFGQSELTSQRGLHTVLVGAEVSRQLTDNFRNTGYFNGTASSISVPFDTPTVSTPVAFRQSATDADNHVLATAASLYLQDQVALGSRWQATIGVRAERFDMDFENHRTAETLRRVDQAVSPRVGVVFKPMEPLSVYSSFSVSYLPSAGDQFSSLTATTQTLRPERFANREVGVKWDLTPMFALTTATYRLDRENTAAPDPINAGLTVQTGRSRSTGVEITLNGQVTRGWDIVGTYASQTAKVLSRTSAALAGATVPLVPRNRASVWNRFGVEGLGFGLGSSYQGQVYAAIDNSVTLPGYWRFDGAVYLTRYRGVTAQLNVENLFDRRYYANSQGNNNIMPGAPRTVRISMTTQIGN